MLTLGIETSCDETAVSVVRDGREILSNAVSSSVHLHREFGGIVPEIASRCHVEFIGYVLKKALREAAVKDTDIDLIAVTQGPGLVGALLVGISFAKALSLAWDVPFVGVNHIQAHIYATIMGLTPKFPFIGLVVSGGHTNIFLVRDFDRLRLLGHTRDDAVGEAFDKVAKMLKLGYPGGPVIEKLARKGNVKNITFSRANLGNNLDFSFSGLKTAVLYYMKKNPKAKVADVAVSFQETAVDMLIEKVLLASGNNRLKRIVVGGGVSRNERLKDKLKKEAAQRGIKVFFPAAALCLDNAAMIAGLGYRLSKKGINSDLTLTAVPNLTVGRKDDQ